jgi:hypothetical protein
MSLGGKHPKCSPKNNQNVAQSIFCQNYVMQVFHRGKKTLKLGTLLQFSKNLPKVNQLPK